MKRFSLRQSMYIFVLGFNLVIVGGEITSRIEMGKPPNTNQINQSFITPTYMLGTIILTSGILTSFIAILNLQTLACELEEALTGHHSPMLLESCEAVFKYLHMPKQVLMKYVQKIRKKPQRKN